jgi:hypothetical protein
VLSDLNRGEVREEGNLLIEAVSLLVQRQRETEIWIAEQTGQAEERAAASERMYAEFEARLAGIEEHLARLMHDIEPVREDLGVDERLERLREQVEGLKSSADGRAARSGALMAGSPAPAPIPSRAAAPSAPLSAAPVPMPPAPRRQPEAFSAPGAGAGTGVGAGQGVSFWQLFGASRQDRFGLVLIGAGAVAVLYAILTQLRFG